MEDVILIALNLWGISTTNGQHRARVSLRLGHSAEVEWVVIVPLNARASPFRLNEGRLSFNGESVADVHEIASDEPVGGYFRNLGRAATLNPNARSRCVGCAFCPNTLEAAADPRLGADDDLRALLPSLATEHPTGDLSILNEVTVSTGCFVHEPAAIAHLRSLRAVLAENRISARLGFLSSVVQSDEGFEELFERVAPFVLRLTTECFTRRDLLLKASKARLSFSQMPDLLRRAKEAGLETSFTYVVGMDSLDAFAEGLSAIGPEATEFPNFQVFQAHNRIMAGLRAPGADDLEFYLKARTEVERVFRATTLRPQAWECYRPLWYYSFADEALIAR